MCFILEYQFTFVCLLFTTHDLSTYMIVVDITYRNNYDFMYNFDHPHEIFTHILHNTPLWTSLLVFIVLQQVFTYVSLGCALERGWKLKICYTCLLQCYINIISCDIVVLYIIIFSHCWAINVNKAYWSRSNKVIILYNS